MFYLAQVWRSDVDAVTIQSDKLRIWSNHNTINKRQKETNDPNTRWYSGGWYATIEYDDFESDSNYKQSEQEPYQNNDENNFFSTDNDKM